MPSAPFSLTRGGPVHAVLERVGIRQDGPARRYWWIAALAWLPIVIGEGARVLVLHAPYDWTLFDLSLHVRLLFALPVMLWAERLLERTARSAMDSFSACQFCEPEPVERILARASRLRDSPWVEGLLVGAAVIGGQLALWNVLGTTGLVHGGERTSMWTMPRLWYGVVALPLVQLVVLRWLWRWAIWTYVLVRLSRLPLFVLATHADGAGGLGPLARPVSGFSGFVLACSSILAAAWSTQVLAGRITVAALLPLLAVFLLAALAVALGPLLLLSGHLFRGRRLALAQYGDFVRAYGLEFHAKWIAPRTAPEPALGSADIQSLNDLGQAFQVVSKTRLFVFSTRNIVTVWFAGLLPMLPLVASMLTVEALLRKIISTIMGGLAL
jgi:hypothetical protein